jgi:hypothetical protein
LTTIQCLRSLLCHQTCQQFERNTSNKLLMGVCFICIYIYIPGYGRFSMAKVNVS